MIKINEIIGKNIKYLRKKKGLSQYDLASLIYRTRSSLAYWELGKASISIDCLISIAEALDVPINVFFKENLEQVDREKERKEEILYLNNLLTKENILLDNYIITDEEFDRIMDFIRRNINLLVDNDNIKKY